MTALDLRFGPRVPEARRNPRSDPTRSVRLGGAARDRGRPSHRGWLRTIRADLPQEAPVPSYAAFVASVGRLRARAGDLAGGSASTTTSHLAS